MKQISSKQVDDLRRIHAKLTELLASLDETSAAVSPQIAAMVKDKTARGICLACGLPITPGEPAKRGQHAGCYSTTRARIARGEFTEESQIQLGKMTAVGKKAGRPAKQDRAVENMIAQAENLVSKRKKKSE